MYLYVHKMLYYIHCTRRAKSYSAAVHLYMFTNPMLKCAHNSRMMCSYLLPAPTESSSSQDSGAAAVGMISSWHLTCHFSHEPVNTCCNSMAPLYFLLHIFCDDFLLTLLDSLINIKLTTLFIYLGMVVLP